MKRWICLFLCVVFALCLTSAAEQVKEDAGGASQKDFWSEAMEWGEKLMSDSSEWLDSALNGASDWAGTAWEEAAKWLEGAWENASEWLGVLWGNASEWVGNVWNESSAWVSEIWGDSEEWMKNTAVSVSESVRKLWTETFEKVTAADEKAWNWLDEAKQSVGSMGEEVLGKIKSAFASGKEDAASAKEAFDDLMEKLKVEGPDVERIRDTIKRYAEEKGISFENAEKIALPYLYQLASDGENVGEDGVPAISIAQYLTGVFEKLGITDDKAAEDLLRQMNDHLQGD